LYVSYCQGHTDHRGRGRKVKVFNNVPFFVGAPTGRQAAVIGRVVTEYSDKVLLKTEIGGHRLLDPLSGEQFPRIC
jgi:hypothetical protein